MSVSAEFTDMVCPKCSRCKLIPLYKPYRTEKKYGVNLIYLLKGNHIVPFCPGCHYEAKRPRYLPDDFKDIRCRHDNNIAVVEIETAFGNTVWCASCFRSRTKDGSISDSDFIENIEEYFTNAS